VAWVRACAIQAVDQLSCSDGSAVFIDALSDRDVRVRRVAVTVLQRTGGAEVLAPLESARKADHWYLRRIYTKAIRKIRRRTA
jgi:HEAT repeat protein